jgi:hypothetical protein
MRPKFIRVNIMIQDDSSSDESESIVSAMAEFKEQMKKVDEITREVSTQVKRVCIRAKEETKDWLNEPLTPKPKLAAWLKENGLRARPTAEEFLDICFDKAKSLDLDSRIVTFRKSDAIALWDAQQQLTVFDIVSRFPSLFE